MDRLRVHYKKCREIAAHIRGMRVDKAIAYLKEVIAGTKGIAMRRHTGGCGRHQQGKLIRAPGNSVAFPTKPTKHFIYLLENVVANAQNRGKDFEALGADELIIEHVQVNRAVKMRRRTYRAHGRISPYLAHPAHIEIITRGILEPVAKEEPFERLPKPLSAKKVAQLKSAGKQVRVIRLRNGASA